MGRPIVSCIIPTKDRADLLVRAVRSLLDSGYESLEILIIDNGSNPALSITDLGFYDPRIRLLFLHEKHNGAAARNLGIKRALGDYICFLDDDDEVLPEKLAIMSDILMKNQAVDAVAGGVLRIDCMSGEKVSSIPSKFSRTRNTIRNNVHNNATLIRSRVACEIFFNEKLERFQDTQFNTDLVFKYNVAYLYKDVATWTFNHGGVHVSRRQGKFFATKNYFKLITHFLFVTKIPLFFLYNHFAILFYYILRRW